MLKHWTNSTTTVPMRLDVALTYILPTSPTYTHYTQIHAHTTDLSWRERPSLHSQEIKSKALIWRCMQQCVGVSARCLLECGQLLCSGCCCFNRFPYCRSSWNEGLLFFSKDFQPREKRTGGGNSSLVKFMWSAQIRHLQGFCIRICAVSRKRWSRKMEEVHERWK